MSTIMYRHLQRSLRTAPTLFATHIFALSLVATLFGISGEGSFAATDKDCFECHSDKTFTSERGGKTISLYVDATRFAGSAHQRIGCIGCHSDADVAEFPHDAGLKEVQCGSCHDEAQHAFDGSIHGRMLKRGGLYAPHCYDCHGKHDIQPRSTLQAAVFKLNIPVLCGKCHKEDAPAARHYDIPEKNIIEHYRDSIHGEGLLKKGLLVTATCIDCHSSHGILPHTDPASTISAHNIAKTCTKCHGLIEQVHQKVIRGEVWEKEAGVIPACVDCHSAHEVRKDSLIKGMNDRDCLKCHEQKNPVVTPADLGASVHFKIPCIKCHSDVSPRHERPCDTSKKVDCSSCHAEQTNAYYESTHGSLHLKQDTDAPHCVDCHGSHKVLSRLNESSPTFRRNVPSLCAQCHREGEKAAVRYKGTQKGIVSSYRESTHGKGVLESGLLPSAVCIDCHTSHRELPASDSHSSVHPVNLPGTCGKCHQGIYEKFQKSVHSPLVTTTGAKLPVCDDCHGTHKITRVEKDRFMQEIVHECGSCHQDVASTYFQTYHGKAYQLGSMKAAKCSDCHGAHDILKPTDIGSHLSRNNVVDTCRKCHKGANRQFTGYLTHATHHNRVKYPILFYTFWGMTMLLVGTFAFFGIHTLLWLPKSIARLKEKRQMHATDDLRHFVRFARRERIMHLFVIISFIGLALTGMMLKFAHMTWATVLSKWIGGVAVAGFIHRVCAIITFGYMTTHLVFLFRQKRESGLSWLKFIFSKNSMVPTWKDAQDFYYTMKWFLGIGERPPYGRWTYWEKFDYFAVFWGVMIIGTSGLMLWFPEWFTKFLPGWVINVATIIHSDEALLAVGFIFTIHFFNTHLRPDAFPMDPVIFTGRIPLAHLKEERPHEYEALVKSGKLEEHLTVPYDERRMKWIYAFGMTCLCAGIILVILIIYSILFGYK